jgi:enolase
VARIRSVTARQILDGVGVPAVEADVLLSDGSRGRASAPGGTSRTPFAVDLRDGGTRFGGQGVTTAVRRIQETIGPALVGHDAADQRGVDDLIRAVDGTPDRSALGANSMLAVSCSVARAAAASAGEPLHRRLARSPSLTVPMPLLNMLSGGDVREFMVAPHGASSFRQALEWGAEIHLALRSLTRLRTVNDEGALTPAVAGNDEAFALLLRAIETAGLTPGEQVDVAIDVNGVDGMAHLYADWAKRYFLTSIEDPLGAEDWDGWTRLTSALGSRLHLTGDSLFAGQASRLRVGVARGAANGVLVKPGQIGTLTETLDLMRDAHDNGYLCTISHRTGETGDPLIASLAVAGGCARIKSGAPVRGERVAIYNELLRLEEELGPGSWRTR